MVQTKVIKTIDEDKNLLFWDVRRMKNLTVTGLIFINTNVLDLGTDTHSLNEVQHPNAHRKQDTLE